MLYERRCSTKGTAQVVDVYDIDVVVSIYNLIEYNHNYSKTFGILWQYCRDELAIYAVSGT